MCERDHESDGDVVAQPRLAVRRALTAGSDPSSCFADADQAPRAGTAPPDGPQRGDQVAAGSAHVLRQQGHDLGGTPGADDPGAVEQRPGQPRVGGDPRDLAAAVGDRAVVGDGAQRRRASSRAAAIATAGGWSISARPAGSGCPQIAISSANDVRSAVAISGSGCAGRWACSAWDQHR